jgi:hypothetical protein
MLAIAAEGEEKWRFGNRPTYVVPRWKKGLGGSTGKGASDIGSPPNGGHHDQGEQRFSSW